MKKINPWTSSLNAAKQLFISGRHLTKNAPLVRPHIHFHQTDDAILNNIRSRGWPDLPVPLSTLRQEFTNWQSFKKMKPLDKASKDKMWDIEEEFLPIILAIPNDLCDSTPMNDTLIHSHQSNICHKDPNIGNKSDIELEDHFAKLELQIQNDLQETFVFQKGFFPLTAPDFIKSPLNLGFMSNAPLQLHHFTDILLAGGASIHSLIAFFVKNEIQSSSSGSKIYSVGRTYDANHLIRQRIVASSLLLNRNEAESLVCREELVESLKEYFIKKHGIPFDIMIKGAHNLAPCESHSLLFKTKGGAVISEISSFKDYISKRLSIIYQDGTHCHLTGGTLCDVTSLIHSSY